jgi:erythromycin esterase
MGQYLDDRYGDEMAVFGFAFHEGTYTARGDDGLGTYGTAPSEVGSAEWAFHQTGVPRFMLDLRLASSADPNSVWLTQPIDLRSIGAQAQSYAFFQTTLTDDFDVMVFFDQSNPSILLDR